MDGADVVGRPKRRRAFARAARIAVAVAVPVGGVLAWAAPLPAPQQGPAENPYSEAKRVLGKALFWDEQLSADDTVSCGTCHLPARGGADSRRVRHPGADGVFDTADDVFGSPGVVHRDAAGNFVPHARFGLDPQVTGRAAPSALTGALTDTNFWDGRATDQFVDPQTSLVAIATGGALESQAVGPPLSAAEMGRDGRTWGDVAAKLAAAAPLALATDLPPDVAAVVAADTRYPDLFSAAFGDGAITARRIAFAIATYERTLVPDQTPWDRYTSGDTTALNAAQVRGLGALKASLCDKCHTPPSFTSGEFRNLGLRPPSEDTGRQAVTSNAADRGKFKVPSLRNVGLRGSFMHLGRFTTLTEVLRFYARAPGTVQFTENIDPILAQINLPPPAAGDIQALLTGGLDDPRAAAGAFPFDRPTLYSERRDHGPSLGGAGRPGTGGVVPRMVAPMPPYLGNAEFRLGVGGALGGAQAWLAVSATAPAGAEIDATHVLGPVVLAGSGSGAGYATMAWPIADDASRSGESVWFQWRVADPSAAGGVALSPVAAVTLFAVRNTSPLVTGDGDLLATSADLTIDWKRHAAGDDADSLRVAGTVNTFGARTLDGATFDLALGGTVLVHAVLGKSGRATSAPGASPAFTARVDAATGRFVAAASGVDLRAATGLAATGGTGSEPLDLGVRLAGAGLAVDAAATSVPFAWRTVAAKRTKAAFRFARDGLVSGAFRPSTTQVRVRTDATRSLRTSGSIEAYGGGFSPDGDLSVVVGGSAVVLPAASLVVRGGGATVTYAASLAGGLKARFVYTAKTRTFSLSVDGLPSSVLPDDGSVASSIGVSIATEHDGARWLFTTTLGLVRASPAARLWRR